MRRDHLVDELHARMFRREAETLARLKHPNIAAIYESGHTEDGHDYFAMELVRGETLDQWLALAPEDRSTPPSSKLRLRLFRTICGAVHYAHQRGVIHRDLKPSNIIVADADGPSAGGTTSGHGGPSVKILDFGLARITDSDIAATMVSEIGMIKGTLPYMSPEQARGDVAAIDVRADVYALGVILYELLAGRAALRCVARGPGRGGAGDLRGAPAPLASELERRPPARTGTSRQSSPRAWRRRPTAVTQRRRVRRRRRPLPRLATDPRPPSERDVPAHQDGPAQPTGGCLCRHRPAAARCFRDHRDPAEPGGGAAARPR